MTKPDRTLQQWVDYIQTLHHREIEMGLERVASVYQRLYPQGMTCKVITVAGTNGKGSTAELVSSIYQQAGYNVGKFTSPHLVDFGERFTINGRNANEGELLAAFERIEVVRAEVPITFFEFGALLAIELFNAAKVDVAVMEVGLGGRLDAINILDADVSIITSISIDHTAWLGDSVEVIAREKAGIARSNRPCVVGIADTPKSIIDHCAKIGAQLHVVGKDFTYEYDALKSREWSWRSSSHDICNLPLPYAQDGVQLSNASLAIYAATLLSDDLPINDEGFHKGVERASILARCQVLSEQPLIVLDVAHNESSVQRLRAFVEQRMNVQSEQIKNDEDKPIKSKVMAVCGMLKDKEIAKSLSVLNPLVDQWHFASIDNERGASAQELKNELLSIGDDFSNINHQTVNCYTKILDAHKSAVSMLDKHDVLIVFGSFFVASDILQIKA